MQTLTVQCPHCGQATQSGNTFCGKCGQSLTLSSPVYRCPYCGTTHPPQIVKRLSTVGYFVLVFGFLLFFVGALFALFFYQDWRMCPVCRKVFY